MSSIVVNPGTKERQRLAWTFLLASFFVCMTVTISVPVGIGWMVRNSTELLDVMVQANEGTVRIDNENGVSDALLVGNPERTIAPNSSVATGNIQSALIFVAPPESDERLARIQVYSNTLLRLEEATTPRFSLSDHAHVTVLKLENGRLQLTIPEISKRPLLFTINTPQGRVDLMEPGLYTVLVTSEATQISVQEGRASVSAVVEEGIRDVMDLVSSQRGEIPTGASPKGPLATERSLLVNGDFADGKSGWTFSAWKIDLVGQPQGTTAVTYTFGESRLHIIRQGEGHADVRFRQTVRQDVTDLESVKIALAFRIVDQALDVCGIVGSECPLFLRINYVDTDGVTQTWQQGFYAKGIVEANNTPDVCVRCALIQDPHRLVTLGQDFFYEVDFAEELARLGHAPPRLIDSVDIVASGHAFNVEVINVDLLVQE
ncbi:MAG: FecR domain-containing protein [Anaerolineales bacterium]|nr:FecR domain-containing protein [Anaerolineales bacterium]